MADEPRAPADAADRAAIKQRIALGYGGGAALYAVGYFAWPWAYAPASVLPRVLLAIKLSAVPALLLFAMFTACLRLRDTPGAIDPLAGAESPRWRVDQRVLSNTTEQALIFVPLLLALATQLDAAHTRLLPLHVACWTLARLAFWAGYRRSYVWRAPGMSATTLTTLATIAWLARFTLAPVDAGPLVPAP